MKPALFSGLLALLLAGSARALPADSTSFAMQCSGRFDSPWATSLAYAPDGSLYSAAVPGRVARFGSDGTLLGAWSGDEAAPPIALAPAGVAIDAQGGVYVTNALLNRVERYTALGTWSGTFGTGDFTQPVGVAVDPRNGRVAVIDRTPSETSSHVRVFLDESVLFSFAVDRWAHGVAIDPAGNIYLASLTGTVEKHDESGAPLASWTVANAELTSLGVGPNGRVHVVDALNRRVYVLSPDLQLLGTWDLSCMEPEICPLPGDHHGDLSGLAIDAAGNAALALDCSSANVQLFLPSATVPVRTVTWGRLKAIYR